LQPFAEEIMSYGFDDKPTYEKLKFLIVKSLLDKEICPNLLFDWSFHNIKSHE